MPEQRCELAAGGTGGCHRANRAKTGTGKEMWEEKEEGAGQKEAEGKGGGNVEGSKTNRGEEERKWKRMK